MKRTDMTKKTARYKGYVALSSGIITAMVATMATPYFLFLGLPFTLFFLWRWLQYRAKWGLRF